MRGELALRQPLQSYIPWEGGIPQKKCGKSLRLAADPWGFEPCEPRATEPLQARREREKARDAKKYSGPHPERTFKGPEYKKEENKIYFVQEGRDL